MYNTKKLFKGGNLAIYIFENKMGIFTFCPTRYEILISSSPFVYKYILYSRITLYLIIIIIFYIKILYLINK